MFETKERTAEPSPNLNEVVKESSANALTDFRQQIREGLSDESIGKARELLGQEASPAEISELVDSRVMALADAIQLSETGFVQDYLNTVTNQSAAASMVLSLLKEDSENPVDGFPLRAIARMENSLSNLTSYADYLHKITVDDDNNPIHLLNRTLEAQTACTALETLGIEITTETLENIVATPTVIKLDQLVSEMRHTVEQLTQSDTTSITDARRDCQRIKNLAIEVTNAVDSNR